MINTFCKKPLWEVSQTLAAVAGGAVPAELVVTHANLINAVLKKIAGSLNIKNHEDAKTIMLNKERFLSPEFKDLWDRIKYKTTFRVNFDPAALAGECAKALSDEQKLVVTYPKYIYGKGFKRLKDKVLGTNATYMIH